MTADALSATQPAVASPSASNLAGALFTEQVGKRYLSDNAH